MQPLIAGLSDVPFSSWLHGVWIGMLVSAVLLHIAVYAMPYVLVPWNALPWAFRIDQNLDLDFQMVTYTAVHDKRIARWSHLSLPLEQVAWVVVLLSWHPLALATVLVLVTLQAFKLGERTFAFWIVAMWGVIAGLGWVAFSRFGAAAVMSSQVLLLLGPISRFIGHVFEPIPPFVGQRRDAFLPLREVGISWRTPIQSYAGTVSEFAAGLPHRLIIVQLWWVAQKMGYRPAKTHTWDEARVIGRAIRTNGWKAYAPTEKMIVTDAPPELYAIAPDV